MAQDILSPRSETAASTTEVVSFESDLYHGSDTEIPELTPERAELTRKQKRPLTRRIHGERSFSRFPSRFPDGMRRTSRPYTPTSYIRPCDGSYQIPSIPAAEFSHNDRPAVEPFSAYRNIPHNAYPTYDYFPNETCEIVGCWQSEFHTHSIEEIMSYLGYDRSQDIPELSQYEAAILKRRGGRIKVTKSTRPGNAGSATSSAKVSAIKLRELELALPSISELPAEAAIQGSRSIHSLTHRPPSKTFSLAFRPMPSKQSATGDSTTSLEVEE